MKYSVFILLWFCLSIYGIGQNLVPNYSFENNTGCPSAGGQLYLAIPWMAIPTNEVEYLNVCSTDPIFSVPFQGGYNYQVAKTGNAYTGIVFYLSPGSNYREYAQVQLTAPLQVNACYYVEFFTNRASGSYGGRYATNNIGCSFTNSAVTNTGTGYVLNLTPHIVKFGNPIISDTLNWTKVSGVFVSSGGENFLTIGNFLDDTNTDTLNIFDGTSPVAYYFIDDVSVIPIDSLIGGMPAFAGNNTSVLIGESVFVGQEVSNLNCNWYDSAGTLIASNTSGIYVQPSSTTYYVVEQNLCGTINYDTVNVIVQPIGIEENAWSKKINIYPNPNAGSFSIGPFNSEIKVLNIKVIDVIGKTVFTKAIDAGDRMFSLNLDSPNGIYMLFVNNPQTNESIVKRIIIQK